MKKLLEIIKENYKTIPYHNFWLILQKEYNPTNQGGICTDKNYFLYKELFKNGYSVKLHSAKINSQNIHQLIKIEIDKQDFLIDTGLGFPIMKPIPLFENAHFTDYGYNFKTEISDNELCLYRLVNNKQVLNYTTNVTEYNQNIVYMEFQNSYGVNIDYPFRNSIRFSKIVDNEFYFLKGKKLYFSESNKLLEREITYWTEFDFIFEKIFKFDLKIAKSVAIKLQMFEN
jgi:arylamine N-acetyltransferase